MRIVMVGTGYVGLVSGVCFSDFGHEVVCVDRDAAKVGRLSAGEVPIYEPGLDALMARNVAEGRLSFSSDLAGALAGTSDGTPGGTSPADAAFIAVGTPSRRGDGHADLSFVFAAAREVAERAQGPLLVVTKSTVPVGTNREVARILSDARPDLAPGALAVASNPEFLREGAAIDDFMRPDRVVVGLDEGPNGGAPGADRAREVMAAIYRPLFLRDFPILWTDLASAEITKYAANAFLATKVAFINEVAALCEAAGADVRAVARGMGLDGRIGQKFLHAGPGYGDSCFPKDTAAFARTGQEHGVPLRITEAVIDSNDRTKARMVQKVRDLLDDAPAGKRVAILGVTFKPNTDDMREAPSLTLDPALLGAGARVAACDPEGRREGERMLPGVEWAEDAYAAARGADLVVLLTEWNQFRALDLRRLAGVMATPRMADLRNVYAAGEARAAGFAAYDGVGRPDLGQLSA